MDKKDLKEIEEVLKRQIDAVFENPNHKRLTEKINAIADSLAAHRADTESHAGYKVSEK